MKRVLWVILAIAFASFLYAGPRVPTPTPNVQKGRGLGIAAHKEIAPTPTATAEQQREVALSGPDTATKEKGKGKMPAYDKEAAPTVTPGDGRALGQLRSQGTLNKEVPPTMTPGVSNPTPNAGRALTFGRDQLKGTTKEAAPTVTPGAVDKTTVNTSKSNTFKEVAPTVTPTDAERLRQQQLQVQKKQLSDKKIQMQRAGPTPTPRKK